MSRTRNRGGGRLYSGDTDGFVRKWDIESETSTVMNKSEFSAVRHLAPAGDDQSLIVVEYSPPYGLKYRGVLKLPDLENHTSRTIASHGTKVYSLAVDAAKRRVMTYSFDGTVRIGPINGEEPYVFAVRPSDLAAFHSGAISPDGNWIAVQSETEESKPEHPFPGGRRLRPGSRRRRTNAPLQRRKFTQSSDGVRQPRAGAEKA